MKTTFLKKKMMPLLILFLGIATAFATSVMSSPDVVANKQGYKFVSQQVPCQTDVMCSDIIGPVCTSGGQQLWGKFNPSSPLCNLPLYKIPN